MSFPSAYVFLTKPARRWQTRCGHTLTAARVPESSPRKGTRQMDIERINLIGTTLADLTRRTEALRGYL